MNIPAGEVLEKRVSFQGTDFQQKFSELMKGGFNGYAALTIGGASGIEEGFLVFRESEIVGALFEATKLGKQFFGLAALRLALNVLRAKHGVFDINRLSRQQVDLIIAFNEKIQLPKPVTAQMMPKLLVGEYSGELVNRALSLSQGSEVSREAVLSKFGLGSIK